MKEVLEFPMWNGRSMIDLVDIVPGIVGADLAWYLLEFDGVGVQNKWGSWDDFQEAMPIRMDFAELGRFAEALDEIVDCLIVGLAATDEPIAEDRLQAAATIEIECFDSTTWTVRSTGEGRLAGVAAMVASRGHPLDRPVDPAA